MRQAIQEGFSAASQQHSETPADTQNPPQASNKDSEASRAAKRKIRRTLRLIQYSAFSVSLMAVISLIFILHYALFGGNIDTPGTSITLVMYGITWMAIVGVNGIVTCYLHVLVASKRRMDKVSSGLMRINVTSPVDPLRSIPGTPKPIVAPTLSGCPQ